MTGYWLNVSYSLELYDIDSTDPMITSAVGKRAEDSGAGFGQRDLHFFYPTQEEANRVGRRLADVGLPVSLEIWSARVTS